jgi:hypothetical protein
VASAPRGAPPPRPSLFFFFCFVFPGLIPSQCHVPISQTAFSWAATDFNWMKDVYCFCVTYLEECNRTNKTIIMMMMMMMMTIRRNTDNPSAAKPSPPFISRESNLLYALMDNNFCWHFMSGNLIEFALSFGCCNRPL